MNESFLALPVKTIQNWNASAHLGKYLPTHVLFLSCASWINYELKTNGNDLPEQITPFPFDTIYTLKLHTHMQPVHFIVTYIYIAAMIAKDIFASVVERKYTNNSYSIAYDNFRM